MLSNTILRKLPFPFPLPFPLQLINKHQLLSKHTIPKSPPYTMNPSSSSSSSRLSALALQLRHYKPPPSSFDDDDDIECESGKVVADVGFAQSSNPIGRNLDFDRQKTQSFSTTNRAAVLVCLFEDDHNGDFRVVLTKRSSKLSSHSGEVALPGGKADEGDKDDIETAKREAHEEIGLDPSLVNAVTTLEPFLSKNLLKVVPVIGILTDKNAFNPVPNTEEVDAVFDAPLEMFIKDENRREEEREWMGHKYLIHYFDYKTDEKSYLIWGLTASILIRAASVVYQREPPFAEQNPRFKIPKFTDKNTVMR